MKIMSGCNNNNVQDLLFYFCLLQIKQVNLLHRSMGNEHAKFRKNNEAEALQRAIKNLSPLEYERLNEEAIFQSMMQQIPVSTRKLLILYVLL